MCNDPLGLPLLIGPRRGWLRRFPDCRFPLDLFRRRNNCTCNRLFFFAARLQLLGGSLFVSGFRPAADHGGPSLNRSPTPVGRDGLFRQFDICLPENRLADRISDVLINCGTRPLDRKTLCHQLVCQGLAVHPSLFGQFINPHPAHSLLPSILLYGILSQSWQSAAAQLSLKYYKDYFPKGETVFSIFSSGSGTFRDTFHPGSNMLRDPCSAHHHHVPAVHPPRQSAAAPLCLALSRRPHRSGQVPSWVDITRRAVHHPHCLRLPYRYPDHHQADSLPQAAPRRQRPGARSQARCH